MSTNNIGFMLRFVNWGDIYNRYIEGEFSHAGVLSTSAVKINSIAMKKTELGFNDNEDRYVVQTRDGTEIILHTTNCKMYKGEQKGTFRCGWCGTDLPYNRVSNTPIITRLLTGNSIRNTENGPESLIDIDIYADKFCCDFSCALAKADRDYSPEVSEYIRFVHRLMYPKVSKLERAPPPEYLDINDGTLTYDEYKAKGSDSYVPTVGITLRPYKRSIAEI